MNKLSVLSRITSVQAKKLSLLVYGLPGAGKTYFLQSSPDYKPLLPMLICVCDSGHLSLHNILQNPDYTVVSTPNLAAFNEVYELLRTKGQPYKTVAIDNLTELHRTSMDEKLQADLRGGKNRTKGMYTQQDYGITRNQILALISEFSIKLKDVNTIFTCLAHNSTDEATGTVTIQPNLAGKLEGEAPGYVDIVGYLYQDSPSRRDILAAKKTNKPEPKRKYVLQVNQSQRVPVARNRGGFLPDLIENPTIQSIYQPIVERVK